MTIWSTCGGRNLSEHGVLGAAGLGTAMRAGAAAALWEAAAGRLSFLSKWKVPEAWWPLGNLSML